MDVGISSSLRAPLKRWDYVKMFTGNLVGWIADILIDFSFVMSLLFISVAAVFMLKQSAIKSLNDHLQKDI